MKYFVILFGFLILVGFTGIALATHDPNQSQIHSIILPPDMKEKTFDEFMEWCVPFYGDKCVKLEKNRIPIILSPLKQIKSGISYDEIQCRESLILVTKHDSSPACVKPETIPRLMERNWIKDDVKQQCEIFSGIWNKDFATCFDFSDEYDCQDKGGKLVSRGYTGEQPDYSKKSDSFACEFRK